MNKGMKKSCTGHGNYQANCFGCVVLNALQNALFTVKFYSFVLVSPIHYSCGPVSNLGLLMQQLVIYFTNAAI